MLLVSLNCFAATNRRAIILRNNQSLAGRILKAAVNLLKHRNKRERQRRLVEGMGKVFKEIKFPCVIL